MERRIYMQYAGDKNQQKKNKTGSKKGLNDGCFGFLIKKCTLLISKQIHVTIDFIDYEPHAR